MNLLREFLLGVLLLVSATSLAAKTDPKYTLPDVPPAQQWEYIDNLMREAQDRMANYDYSAAQVLLTERCALLDLYYEKNGADSAIEGKTGYEYLTIVPKLYCNLRIGQVEKNLDEIAHLREQYQMLFDVQHPQNDLLETEVAETYFRMGNIGMAIETAEKLVDRLSRKSKQTSVAYHKIYYRLMAYYQSIGRTYTLYFSTYYTPENEVYNTNELYCYLFDDEMTFQQKMTNVVERTAKLIHEEEYSDARESIQVGKLILDEEYPMAARQRDAEIDRRYNLLRAQLLTLQSKTYKYISFEETEIEECLIETYLLSKQLFGQDSPEVADAAEMLGRYYYDAENNQQKAAKYYHEAMGILKSADNYRKGQLIDIMGALMQCYAGMDNAKAVATLAKDILTTTKDMIVVGFAFGSSAERADLWDKYNHWLLKEIPRLAVQFEGQMELGAELYDIALFSKGLLMLSDNAMTELVMKKGNPELMEEGRKLHALRLQLHEQLTSSKFSAIRVIDTRNEIEKVEHSLLAKVNQLGDWQQGLSLGWRDIQKRLKKGETAIEFLEYSVPFLGEDKAIIAVVLTADAYLPIMRKFCPDGDLAYSEEFEHCSNTRFYQKYWSQLESDLSETSTIYFSPIGVLNIIPIEYCPVDDSCSLFDKYKMYRLTSTRKILDRSKPQAIKTAYLFGGINYAPALYSLNRANIELMKEGYVEEGTSGLTKTSTLDPKDFDSMCFTNHLEWMRVYSATLSSTALLNDFLNTMGCNVHYFHDYRATEECFKGMSRKPVDVLIVNTHGFTYNSGTTDTDKYTFTYKWVTNRVSSSELAMTLSGLLLSGASMAHSPKCDRGGLEDGIITAAEIAQLNLQNVQLVHLSACETGLGKISEEGVLGLQRGFKRAGAKAIISTLAPAYTDVVTYFDTTFYRNLFYDQNGKKRKTQSIHDAFYSSIKKVRELRKVPKYWCVNVLTDALD